jgi:hypothetical protein
MRNPPIRRQIFFWLTIFIFLISAPTIVFYTAGYRWNPKKGVIERNGTLIIDTTPVGASILLNGQEQEKITPVTLKNLSPGTYQIDLSLNGYHHWTKTLQVTPERVTFANNITLWLDAEPTLSVSGSYGKASISPNGKVAIAVKREGKTERLVMMIVSSGLETLIDTGSRTQTIERFEWNDDSSAVIVKRIDGTNELVVRRDAEKSIELPSGFFRWEDGILIGALDGNRYAYDVSNDLTTYDPFDEGVKDVFGNYQIISSTGTQTLALIERGENIRFDLPSGDWRFASKVDGFIYLRSGDDWLSFDPSDESTTSVRFKSQTTLSPSSQLKQVSFLSLYGGEMSLGQSGQTASLLVRKSDSIIGAMWHESEKYILYATTHEITALDLDDRDHRIETTLAVFDEITDFSYQKRELIIFGKKGDQQGIWKLAIE